MRQIELVRNLSSWLTANKWHNSLTITYDLTNNGERGESLRGPLYVGEKTRGSGRKTQTAQPDILARRDDIQTVDLIVEVEVHRKLPKQYYALFGAPVFADNHTPSNQYGDRRRYRYQETVIVVVTLRCKEIAELVAESMRNKMNLAGIGIAGLFVCGGENGQAETEFKQLIMSRFHRVGPG